MAVMRVCKYGISKGLNGTLDFVHIDQRNFIVDSDILVASATFISDVAMSPLMKVAGSYQNV